MHFPWMKSCHYISSKGQLPYHFPVHFTRKAMEIARLCLILDRKGLNLPEKISLLGIWSEFFAFTLTYLDESGIGLDDTFVLVAAWRRTNPRNSVGERMRETYSEAAVSITITSVTDGLSFLIGAFTDIPSIYIFCMYAGSPVVSTLPSLFFQWSVETSKLWNPMFWNCL